MNKTIVIHASRLAQKCLVGRFIVLRVDSREERIPLIIADFDRQVGSSMLVYREVGKSTLHLDTLEAGEAPPSFTDPLGQATPIKKFGTVLCVGGGVGTASGAGKRDSTAVSIGLQGAAHG